uniref:Uncharacterized protein n=1 Tax=Pseudomonas savastanoi pv. phaseolicola TaxID=319 RepID=Q5QG09_PSESH|nr:unknown [Pseudomonas savastanoi pv. phaseolicola]
MQAGCRAHWPRGSSDGACVSHPCEGIGRGFPYLYRTHEPTGLSVPGSPVAGLRRPVRRTGSSCEPGKLHVTWPRCLFRRTALYRNFEIPIHRAASLHTLNNHALQLQVPIQSTAVSGHQILEHRRQLR